MYPLVFFCFIFRIQFTELENPREEKFPIMDIVQILELRRNQIPLVNNFSFVNVFVLHCLFVASLVKQAEVMIVLELFSMSHGIHPMIVGSIFVLSHLE